MEKNHIITTDIEPYIKLDIETLTSKSDEAKNLADLIIIDDDETNLQASEALSRIKAFAKDCEAERIRIKAPFAKTAKLIDDFFKPFLERFDDAETVIKRKIKDYMIEKDRRIAEARRKAEEEYRKKLEEERELAEIERRNEKIIAPPPAIINTQKVEAPSGTISRRKIWKWELEDINKVPLKYMTIDEKLINQAVRSGIRAIPGIRIYEDFEISGRTR